MPSFDAPPVAPLDGDTLAAVASRLHADCRCAICFELFISPHSLPCGHTFCGPCISSWAQKSGACPCCRAASGGRPGYSKILCDLLTAVLEPRMSSPERAERCARRADWAATQRAAWVRASAEHAAEAAAAAGRAQYGDIHRQQRVSTEQLAAEMRALQQRNLFAAPGAGGHGGQQHAQPGGGGGTQRALRAAAAVRAPPPAPPVTLQWVVDTAPAASTCVCHTCFRAIRPGSLRCVHESAPPPWADLATPEEVGSQPPVREMHHVTCCLPPQAFPADRILGLSRLSETHREELTAAVTARDNAAYEQRAAGAHATAAAVAAAAAAAAAATAAAAAPLPPPQPAAVAAVVAAAAAPAAVVPPPAGGVVASSARGRGDDAQAAEPMAVDERAASGSAQRARRRSLRSSSRRLTGGE